LWGSHLHAILKCCLSLEEREMSVRRVIVVLVLMLLWGPAWGFNAEDLLIDLKETTGAKQHEAALRLGDFKYPDVIAALSEKLDDKTTATVVRAACAQSLGKLNDASTYPMIQSLAKNKAEKGVVRAACVQAMGVMKKEGVIDELVEMLKTEKTYVVRGTIEQVLGNEVSKDRVALAVSPLLQDEKTAPSAIRILGKVGGPRVVTPLAEQLKSPRAPVRLAVITALGAVKVPAAAEHLVAYYPQAKDVAERNRILAALSHHPHVKAVELLVTELVNPKTFPALRRRAALSLGEMKAKPGIRALVSVMLNTTEHHGLRLTCVQALGAFGDRDDPAIAGLIGALADAKLQKRHM